MSTKTITTTVTLVERVKDGDTYVNVNRAPGTPVRLPAADADAILARFGGEEVKPEKPEGRPAGGKGA